MVFFEGILDQLESEYQAENRSELFQYFVSCLQGNQKARTHADAAIGLGLAEGSLKNGLTEMRHRFARMAMHRMTRLMGDREEAKKEMGYLISLFDGFQSDPETYRQC
jgi:hypothetical protein